MKKGKPSINSADSEIREQEDVSSPASEKSPLLSKKLNTSKSKKGKKQNRTKHIDFSHQKQKPKEKGTNPTKDDLFPILKKKSPEKSNKKVPSVGSNASLLLQQRSRIAQAQLKNPKKSIAGAVLLTSLFAGVVCGLLMNPALSSSLNPIKGPIDNITPLNSNYINSCDNAFTDAINQDVGNCYYNTTNIVNTAIIALKDLFKTSAHYSFDNFNWVAFSMGFLMTGIGEIGAIWSMWVMNNAISDQPIINQRQYPVGANPLYEANSDISNALANYPHLQDKGSSLVETTTTHKKKKKNQTISFMNKPVSGINDDEKPLIPSKNQTSGSTNSMPIETNNSEVAIPIPTNDSNNNTDNNNNNNNNTNSNTASELSLPRPS